MAIDRSIWVTDRDFESFVVLLSKAGGAGGIAPRISPRGLEVAFVDLSGEEVTVRVASIDGTRIAALGVGFDVPTSLAWSLDGRTLYMTGQHFRENGLAWKWRDSDPPVEVAFLRSRDVISHSAVEPLFALARDGDIWVQPADGGTPTNLTGSILPLEISKLDPRWSPDGRWVLFRAVYPNADARNGFYVIGRDGSGLRQVVSDVSYGYYRAIFSGDGEELLIHRRSPTAPGDEIITQRLDGSTPRVVSPTGRESEVDFDWR